MEVGHVFTIEPMICEGTYRHVEWVDGWTATTKDGKRSAQFEHTLLVTPTGVEPLTGKLPSSPKTSTQGHGGVTSLGPCSGTWRHGSSCGIDYAHDLGTRVLRGSIALRFADHPLEVLTSVPVPWRLLGRINVAHAPRRKIQKSVTRLFTGFEVYKNKTSTVFQLYFTALLSRFHDSGYWTVTGTRTY
eukprot:199945-Prymnesium_polylepis.1